MRANDEIKTKASLNINALVLRQVEKVGRLLTDLVEILFDPHFVQK